MKFTTWKQGQYVPTQFETEPKKRIKISWGGTLLIFYNPVVWKYGDFYPIPGEPRYIYHIESDTCEIVQRG